VGHASCMRKMRNAYKILVGKSEGKALLVRLIYRRSGNLKWLLEKR